MRRILNGMFSLTLAAGLCLSSSSVVFAELTDEAVISQDIIDNFMKDIIDKAEFYDEHNHEYYVFDKYNIEYPQIHGRIYLAPDRYTLVRITANDSYESDKVEEMLGEAYENRFAPVLGLELLDNHYVYRYSDEVNYDDIYKMPGVEKIEFQLVTSSHEFFRTFDDKDWYEERGIDLTEVICSRIYTSPEVEITEEMFSSLDTEIFRLFKKEGVDSKGLARWYISYKFKGDFGIYNDLDSIVKQIDENSYSHPVGFTHLMSGGLTYGLTEYIPDADSSNNNTTGDDDSIYKSDKNLAGDINNDGKTDVTDLSELSLALVGDSKLTEAQQKAADVDSDGAVKLADLAKFRQYLSKVISSLG